MRRVHQEDFCQALGYYAEQKYENEGGPGYLQCFSLLNKYSHVPLSDKISLVRWAVFNFIIGNSDAHAKNLSLLFREGRIQLAPFYDLMSTCIYEGINEKMAMRIDGKYERQMVVDRHWERFSAVAEIPFKLFQTFRAELVLALKEETPALSEEFISKWGAAKTIEKIKDFILKQVMRMEG